MDLKTVIALIAEIKKNEIGAPTDIVNQFIQEIYYTYLHAKVDSVLKE